VDTNGLIIAVLAGQPDDPSWHEVHGSAYRAIASARMRCYIPKKDLDHRRGIFPALSIGISFGGGQSVGFFNSKQLKPYKPVTVSKKSQSKVAKHERTQGSFKA
jgi:hypothetical protein